MRGLGAYLIFEPPTEDRLEVLRVLHGARDLGRALGESSLMQGESEVEL